MSTTQTQYCYRHPDRETGLSCSECGRPICADCANFGPVGIRCPDHASVRRGGPTARIKPPTVHRAPGIALATGRAPVTWTLIAINAVIYLITVVQGHAGFNHPGGFPFPRGIYLHWLLFGPLVAHGGWYRLVTSMFLHGYFLHILFNMAALYFIGPLIERYLGPVRYIGLYFVSGLAGAAGSLLQAPLAPTVGASGAIFGILGAWLIIEWQATGRLAGNAMTWIVISLVFTFINGSNISWGGHIGGLIGGILITLAYGHWSNRGRAQYGQLGLGGVIGLAGVAAGSIAIAYFRVRGYA